MGSQMPYRTSGDRRPIRPPASGDPDQLDRTAQQVRIDHENTAVHRVRHTWLDPWSGAIYQTACDETLSKIGGAILTTREVDCGSCLNGRKRPQR